MHVYIPSRFDCILFTLHRPPVVKIVEVLTLQWAEKMPWRCILRLNESRISNVLHNKYKYVYTYIHITIIHIYIISQLNTICMMMHTVYICKSLYCHIIVPKANHTTHTKVNQAAIWLNTTGIVISHNITMSHLQVTDPIPQSQALRDVVATLITNHVNS